ncbi:hypothetical protein N0V90_008206 [Kalmusia sp. IMI 367209]|nr:hypothetical protein N0V90_008206 [Kalmusia sp. IMI 367209]
MSEDINDVKVFNKNTVSATYSSRVLYTNRRKGEAVRFYITETGLLFSTISDAAPPFDEFFPDLKPLINTVDFTNLPYRRSIKYEGKFNWKTIVYYPPTFYTVYNHKNFCQHVADPSKADDGLFLYFFPNCTLNVYGGGMSSFRVCPTEKPGVTRMEFDYYHLESGDKFDEYYKFVRQVAMEDYELCEKAQENLEKGIYSEGILNPEKETGVAYYQQQVLDLVCAQHETDMEEQSPALQAINNSSTTTAVQLVDPTTS